MPTIPPGFDSPRGMDPSALYEGILPKSSAATSNAGGGLTTRVVPLVQVDATGTPILPRPPSLPTAPWSPSNALMQALRGGGNRPMEGTGPSGNRLTAGEPGLSVGSSYLFGYSPYDASARNSAVAAAAALGGGVTKQDLIARGVSAHERLFDRAAGLFAGDARRPIPAGIFSSPGGGVDPWEGLRAPGEDWPASEPPPFVDARGGVAPQGDFMTNLMTGLGSLVEQISNPFAVRVEPETLDQMRRSPDYAPEQVQALEKGKRAYAPVAGAFVPTMAPGGKPRRSSGDSSVFGSGGSLVGR